MRTTVFRFLLLLAATLGAGGAAAAVSCSASSLGFTAFYLPADPVDVTQSSVTVTCTATAAGDAGALNYTVRVNNGLYAVPNQARRPPGTGGANRITYDTYRDSGCSALWGGTAATQVSGSLNITGAGTFTQTTPWWGCIPTGQTGKNTGTFTDTVRMTLALSRGTVTGAPFTFPVSIYHPASCVISPTPGTIALAYTSFSATPVTGGTTFGLNCTNNMPYTLSLNAYAGTLLGLNYTLLLNNGTLGTTGTGSVVTIPIDATIPAGQSGTCALATCNAAQTHILEIAY